MYNLWKNVIYDTWTEDTIQMNIPEIKYSENLQYLNIFLLHQSDQSSV